MDDLSLRPARAAEAGRLWETFAASLRRWFAHRARQDEVDDLVQETFARVLGRLDELEDIGRLGAWVQRIAQNVWIDARRRSRRHAGLELEPEAPERDRRLESEVAVWLGRFVDGIDPEHARVLRRADLEGQTQRAIAADLGLSLSAVKSRVQRGREKVRRSLEACCRFEFDRRGGLLECDPREPQSGDCGCD